MKIKLFHTKSKISNAQQAWRHAKGMRVPTNLMALCTDGRSRRVYVENNLQRAHAFVLIHKVKHFIKDDVFGYDNLRNYSPEYVISRQTS